ncbi:CoA ester lyase [Parasphingorhabdus sp.]|uniref:HpcH/HpaI aldolase/citrate lyase family protein n=1 Tax=Parasphingorhabdus sp. TaxID=2709688 RepID=UPI0032EE37C1
MMLRSLLFVPADDERKLHKALSSGADALILDLEDSVVPHRKEAARELVPDFVETAKCSGPSIFVRVNALSTGMTVADLNAVVGPGIAGVMLPKAEGATDLALLSRELDICEGNREMPRSSIKVIVVATETPRAIFNLGSYAAGDPRLIALTWGAEDLAAAIGATENKEVDGRWTTPYEQVRSLCLFASAAAVVPAIDTLYSNFRDTGGLAEDCRRGRRDGFSGRIAIHPAQIEIINEAYTPTSEDIAAAQRIVDVFAANPDAGTLGIDGKMFDIPHLMAAKRTLACRN